MEPYIRKVHYYETDKMGCVHHSNYIRWMEEARVAYLERAGIGFPMLEERGIYSPVVGVECRYRRPTHFDETIRITAKITEYTGVRLRISYEMINGQGVLVSTGSSEHCFTDTSGHPVILKNLHPDIDAVIRAAVEE